jgi:hypothetical protein
MSIRLVILKPVPVASRNAAADAAMPTQMVLTFERMSCMTS